MNSLRLIGGVLLLIAIGWMPSSWIIGKQNNSNQSDLRVGSKAFTENIILAEVVRLSGQDFDLKIDHQAEIQGTQIVFQYLLNQSVDIYPEYTGTIRYEILRDPEIQTEEEIRKALRERFDLVMSGPLGFENTYAIGMLESRAEELGIETISDLRNHPELSYSLSQEFIEREDGWKKMAAAYNLETQTPKGNDHALTYRQLETGAADVIVLYSTDSKILTMDIRVLEDDLEFFPSYAAVFLYRAELAEKHPHWIEWVESLSKSIKNEEMIRLNARCEVDKLTEQTVAAEYLKNEYDMQVETYSETLFHSVFLRTVEHLDLVRMSLVACILIAIPLGVIAAKQKVIGQVVLGTIGVLQTVPGIALLVILIAPVEWLGRNWLGQPGMGASVIPVIVALFIYSLLPIVRNTYTGLTTIASPLSESADALGLGFWAKLRRVELPLAMPSILAGIKTAAVINVGFACLGAMIGGGGYGQPIFSGVRLSDTDLILQGAVPAAILALLVQGFFELVERRVTPPGLRA